MDHRRWFRRLLRILPADFQADYAVDMERTFEAQRRDAGMDRGGVLRLWLETSGDLLRTAPREHLDRLIHDVRYASRTMARHPSFAIVAVILFAGGIAASTAVFSIVRAAVLSPIPFDRPGRLVSVGELTRDEGEVSELSYVSYLDLRRGTKAFESVAAYMRNGVLIGGSEPELGDAALISANLLATLRIRPLIGRAFAQTEDAPGGLPVALVGERFARRRFGSAERAMQQAIPIDSRLTQIVGVLPAGFRFPDDHVEVWLPIGQLGDQAFMRNRAVHVALVVARLRDDVSLAEVRTEVNAWMDGLQAREPSADPDHRVIVRTLAQQVSADARPAVAALAGAVVLLLAVTCGSVALLLLMRAAGRSNEVAIRLALGASRPRLARQLATEALCLAALGAAGGLVLAPLLLRLLVSGLREALPPLVIPSIDVRAFAFALATATIVAVVCGLVPATQALKPLRTRATRVRRAHAYVVAAQVAVSCVLLVVAALLGRSLDRLLRVDPGFDADHLLVMRVNAPLAGYSGPGQMTRFYEAALTRIVALPAVVAATATNAPPLRQGGVGVLTVEGVPERALMSAMYRRVLPGYFATLRVPLLEGRDFTRRDDGRGEKVVIVSQSLARRFWPTGQAVGKRIKVGPAESEPWLRIIGVVGNVRNASLDGGPDLTTYEPHAQRPWNGMFVMVRTAGEPTGILASVRLALREIEPQVVVSAVSTMEDLIDETVASRRFHATVVGAFAAATLVLVAVALYGVLAYSLTSRTRELGIRSAMGATVLTLTREALIEGLRPVLAGMAVGLGAAAVAATGVRTLLFQITPGDVWTYAGAVSVLMLVALASSWLPARRAARVDPSTALRVE